MARRSRYRKAQTVIQGGIAYDVLAQALLQQSDFQQVIAELGNRLRHELLQQLIKQPLQQLGTNLGQELQGNLFGAGADNSFARSDLQLGALLQDLLGEAEKIL
jgi:hypothetical protein